ncbi:MAG: methyl-accepting chemotaxis protein [Chloroflexi bacterium]|nr:methyl-accepting chemotaxis protein [Chloroflexota bacterium]
MKLQSKLTLALLLASLFPLVLIGWYSTAVVGNLLRQGVRNDASIALDNLAMRHFETILSIKMSDAYYLSNSIFLDRLLQAQDENDAEGIVRARQDLAREFETVAALRGEYFKIRYIDSTGQEVVEIERQGPSYTVSKGASLQNEREDKYFTEAFKLADGQMFVSDLRLETQGGKIVVPHQPGIRIATPVIYQGTRRGVLVLNVDGSPFLQVAKEEETSGSQLFMVDESGNYLVHPNENKLWGSQLGTGHTLDQDEPALAKLVRAQGNGTYEDANRLIIFRKVPIQAAIGPHWTLIEVTPKAVAFATMRNVQGSTLAIIFLALVMSVGGGWFVARRIARPVEALSHAVEGFRAGDFTISIPVTEDDEIGKLAASFSHLATGMGTLIGKVEEGAAHLVEATEALSAASQQVETGSEQVSIAVQQIAEGARAQAREIGVTSRGIASQARATTDTAKQSAATAEQVKQAHQAALASTEGIQVVVKRLQETEEANRKVVRLVAQLGENSAEMEQVIATINSFADQTNMLALNASIEAARAGAQGRGFSVVANEVRRLARRSGRSATEVADLISQTQQRTTGMLAQAKIEQQAISAGAKALYSLRETLETIVKSMERASKMAEKISQITVEQQKTSETMVQAMNTVAAVAESNVVSTEQASASLQEQTAATEELAASARQLAQLTAGLRETVAHLTGQEAE